MSKQARNLAKQRTEKAMANLKTINCVPSTSTGVKKTLKVYNTKPLEKYLLGSHCPKGAFDGREDSKAFWPSEYENPKRGGHKQG